VLTCPAQNRQRLEVGVEFNAHSGGGLDVREMVPLLKHCRILRATFERGRLTS